MKYYLIVGEASGDLHASRLMLSLKKEDPHAEFRFFGGDLMSAVGGTRVRHYRELAYMGFVPVLLHLRTILGNMKMCKRDIVEWGPDVVILVDYPGFNLGIAKYVRAHTRIPVYYYISPKIWAWKEWRIKSIRRDVSEMFSILPFEVDFYEDKHHYPIHYVGNPTAEEIVQWKTLHAGELPREHIIAILPGSRKGEISKCLPMMLAAAKAVADRIAAQGSESYRIVVAGAPGIDDSFYAPYLRDTDICLTRDTYRLVSQAAAAVVNSGTATLETALLGCPQVAVYHIACSKHLMWLKPLVFSIPYFTLVNLIAEKEVIKELVGGYFTQANMEQELTRLLTDTDYRRSMLTAYEDITLRLGSIPAAQNAAHIITAAQKTLQ